MSNNADKLKQVDRRIGVYFLRNAEDKFAASDFRILHEHAAHLPGVLMVRTMTVGDGAESRGFGPRTA